MFGRSLCKPSLKVGAWNFGNPPKPQPLGIGSWEFGVDFDPKACLSVVS